MSAANLLGKFKQHLPGILTGTGITQMLIGTGLAVKATPEALRRIKEKKEEEGHERLTVAQTIQATWRCYIWAAATTLSGAGCVIAGMAEANKRQATLMLSVNAAESGLREFLEYRRYVAERIGEKQEREIHNQALQKMVNENPPPADMYDREIVEGTAPTPMCYDISFSRYYYLSYDKAVAAVNKMNHKINTSLEGYVSINDLYDEMGVTRMQYGDNIGWSQETGPIAIVPKERLQYAGTPSGWPCWVLEFENPPQYEFKYFRQR